jgi:hypothetical protein
MITGNELGSIVNEIEDVLGVATADPGISSADLRRVLAFLAKVAQVVDQSFQDVLAVLIEFKFVTANDLNSGRVRLLDKELELLVSRSRYRDAEEICSRLSHLRVRYEEQIEPVISHLLGSERRGWRELFWLVEEREGRIILLVQSSLRQLKELLSTMKADDVPRLNLTAAEMADALRSQLTELRCLTNEIMGLSGRPGFLELTSNRDALTKEFSVFINQGTMDVSRDTYKAEQVGAMGPGARAHNMTFQQIWNQAQASGVDLQQLAGDLARLRIAMRAEATSAEHDVAVGQIAAAESAASKGNGATAMEHLRSAGQWAFEVATNIGTGVATAALKLALGL